VSLLDAVWDTLFPPRCLGCGRRGHAVCPECAATLVFLPPGACPRCATPPPRGRNCHGCRRLSPALVSVRAVCVYEGVARTAVHTLKFRSGRYLVPLLGALLRENLARQPLRADLVVPVPMPRRRLRERGYNQATLLAEQVVDAVGAILAGSVLEKDDRPVQRGLPAAARLANLRGAIRCTDPARVRGRRVLLADDVMTTGATLSSCAEALAEAGAERVSGLVFARD
jgi:ComF family protein